LLLMTAVLWLAVFSTRIGAAPSGSGRIAFISDRGGKPQIYIMNADGSNINLLIDPPRSSGASGLERQSCVQPQWSKDRFPFPLDRRVLSASHRECRRIERHSRDQSAWGVQ
jgi:hypothetical protein